MIGRLFRSCESFNEPEVIIIKTLFNFKISKTDYLNVMEAMGISLEE